MGDDESNEEGGKKPAEKPPKNTEEPFKMPWGALGFIGAVIALISFGTWAEERRKAREAAENISTIEYVAEPETPTPAPEKYSAPIDNLIQASYMPTYDTVITQGYGLMYNGLLTGLGNNSFIIEATDGSILDSADNLECFVQGRIYFELNDLDDNPYANLELTCIKKPALTEVVEIY